MTYLEQLIRQQAALSVTTTMSRATEKIAKEMAREILRDPKFRAWKRTFVKQIVDNSMRDLTEPARRNSRHGKKGRRRG